MMPSAKDFLRVASLFAVLAAGSCAAPINGEGGLVDDPMVNHPIVVAPHYRSIRLSFSAPQAGLMPDDAQRFDDFVAAYIQHGNGAISISAPTGRDAQAAIGYFGERLASAGVPREHILVGTADTRDGKVEIGYIGYQATTDTCGDFSSNLGDTASNRTSANLGCATQHNIAAMVADPRDLMGPATMASGDASRRATVYDNYRKGQPTGATLSADQSGAVSDVAK
jgi:pilus assembly protein CpaD